MANDLIFNATATYATGKFGQGLSGGRADFPLAILSDSSALPFTIEGWFKTTSASAITVIAGHYGSSNLIWYMGVDASGKLTAYYNNTTGSNISLSSSTNVADGTNHHCAVVFSSSGMTVFLDGQSIGSIADTKYNGAGAGGKFTLGYFNNAYDFVGAIDEVAVWNTARYTGTFTPPASPYTGNESGMTALYHLNSSGANSQGGTTPPAGTTVAANSSALVTAFAPYVWRFDGTSMNANSPGSYAKFRFSGTSLVLNTVALSGLPNEYPRIGWSIDDGPVQTATLGPGVTTQTIATGLASGSHTVELWLAASDQGADRWGLADALKITGFTLDNGASITAPTLRSKRAIWYGDSISEGFHALSFGGDGQATSSSDAYSSVVQPIGKALDAEIGQVAYTGQGFVSPGGGGVPALNAVYGSYSSGVSRLVNGVLSPAPDYVLSMHGTNGSPSQSDVAAQIANWRTVAPTAIIIMIVPPGGFARAAITAATNAAISAGDTNVKLIDMGTSYQTGLTNYGAATRQSYDGYHPHALCNMRLAAKIMQQMQHALEPRRFTVVAS